MNYSVIWVPSAEDQLAAIWIASVRQAAVTAAADRIDQLLGTAPNGVGESRADGYRVLIDLPLVAYYQVADAERLVRVLRVIGR